jgi:exonuclease SbcC
MDSFTGIFRPFKTLSALKFFLPRSLWLRLSDVVQAMRRHQAGHDFVDEGIGSLDPESLSMAIRTLTDLQKRAVAWSEYFHVAELKERNSTRLEITPGPRGCSACFRI